MWRPNDTNPTPTKITRLYPIVLQVSDNLIHPGGLVCLLCRHHSGACWTGLVRPNVLPVALRSKGPWRILVFHPVPSLVGLLARRLGGRASLSPQTEPGERISGLVAALSCQT